MYCTLYGTVLVHLSYCGLGLGLGLVITIIMYTYTSNVTLGPIGTIHGRAKA